MIKLNKNFTTSLRVNDRHDLIHKLSIIEITLLIHKKLNMIRQILKSMYDVQRHKINLFRVMSRNESI